MFLIQGFLQRELKNSGFSIVDDGTFPAAPRPREMIDMEVV